MKGGGSLFSRPTIEETIHTPSRVQKEWLKEKSLLFGIY